MGAASLESCVSELRASPEPLPPHPRRPRRHARVPRLPRRVREGRDSLHHRALDIRVVSGENR